MAHVVVLETGRAVRRCSASTVVFLQRFYSLSSFDLDPPESSSVQCYPGGPSDVNVHTVPIVGLTVPQWRNHFQGPSAARSPSPLCALPGPAEDLQLDVVVPIFLGSFSGPAWPLETAWR